MTIVKWLIKQSFNYTRQLSSGKLNDRKNSDGSEKNNAVAK